MFFVHIMGRRAQNKSASSLEMLGEVVTKAIASEANSAIVVSVGKTDQAVMPYVWIRRNDDDAWEGELGDCIKLGIEDGLIVERDPIQMLGLDQAIQRGIVEVYDDGVGPVISVPYEPPQPKAKKQVESFVIIDDDSDMVHLMDKLVQTSFDKGLQDEHVEMAIKVLAVKV